MNLKKKLVDENDYAVSLHLIVVLLFYKNTSHIVHIPGKFVPNMISALFNYVPDQVYKQLLKCQKLITLQWKAATVESQDSTETDISSNSEVLIAATPVEDKECESVSADPSVMDDNEAELILLINELKHLVA